MKRKGSKIAIEIRRMLQGALVRLQPSARNVVPNKVVLTAHYGHGYGCNPKYIAEALRARNDVDLDLVWLSASHDSLVPSDIRQVNFYSRQALWELATAKVWVDNMRTRRYIPKKSEQFYLQTWHGCLSPKRLEADIEQHLSSAYVRGAKADSQAADLFICNNDFYENIMRNSFWYNGPILRCGLPRNAVLLRYNPHTAEEVRKRLGVPEGARVCLYAPTFRDSEDMSAYAFDYQRCCDELGKRFGGSFVFVLRLHPNVADAAQTFIQPGVIDASWYGDAEELLCAADVVITDYSSMAEDFALLGRPGFQYVPDVDAFNQDRGLYYPLEIRPFPVAYSEEELYEAIRSTDDAYFDKKRKSFFARMGLDDDGQGDQVVAQRIIDVITGGAH